MVSAVDSNTERRAWVKGSSGSLCRIARAGVSVPSFGRRVQRTAD